MDKRAFVKGFFANVDKRRYKLYDNRDGRQAVDFGHKQLHEDHLAKLYKWAVEHSAELSTADFAQLVPGRPCASRPFFETCERAQLCELERTFGNTRVYRFKV